MGQAIRSHVQRAVTAVYLTKHRGRVSIGKHCQIPFHTVRVQAGQVRIGDHVCFGRRVVLEGASFTFGDHSSCGHDVSIRGAGTVFEMGKFSTVGAGTSFLLGQGRHRPQALSTFPFGYLPPFRAGEWASGLDGAAQTSCTVGHDVYIGVGCLILPNITIGDGAIVSPGAVVRHDVPSYAIVGGSPAQVISFRFKQSLIKELLELKWWDWPLEKIHRNAALFRRNLMTRTSLSGIQTIA